MDLFKSPALLELLRAQPLARREQIARAWSFPSPEPAALHRHIVGDTDRFDAVVAGLPQTPAVQTLLVDMMQEYGTPMSLHPEDRAPRRELAERGLVFPWTPEKRGRVQRSGWVMPLEIAILCARSVPIYRMGLPLLLGHAGPEKIAAMRKAWGLMPRADFLEDVLDMAGKLSDRAWLGQALLDPDWNEHLFTLQIVLEWSGVCHRQELFSYAWGDDILRPFAGRGQQAQEKRVEGELLSHGLLFEYAPPTTCGDPECTVHHEEAEPLIVLPEETRACIWKLGREIQEQALGSMLGECGGWAAARRPSPVGPPVEPVDQLKALGCVLEAGQLPMDDDGGLSEAALGELQKLTGAPSSETNWSALVSAGVAGGVLAQRANHTLTLGTAAARVLDDRPVAWSRTLLSRWVLGIGPPALDEAQNRAFGLSASWLAEVRTILERGTAEPRIAWWRYLDDSDQVPPPPVPELRPRRRGRRKKPSTPVPTWLSHPGDVGDNDVCCGYPRPEDKRDTLETEVALLETIVTTFRLLVCDLLGGLPRKHPVGRESLAILLQEAAAFSVHLGLAALIVDTTSHLFVPVRPPSYLVESSSDESFNQLADALLEHLLIPAGAAVIEDDHVLLWPDRLAVDTPRHVDHDARLVALCDITGITVNELATTRAETHRPLRSVAGGTAETERRFWLGRPLGELRRAVAGRRVTALTGGYVEVAADD